MDREETQYMKEMQDLLWQAYDVLLNIPYGNVHRKEGVKIARGIVELLEERHLSSRSSRAAECCAHWITCAESTSGCIEPCSRYEPLPD